MVPIPSFSHQSLKTNLLIIWACRLAIRFLSFPQIFGSFFVTLFSFFFFLFWSTFYLHILLDLLMNLLTKRSLQFFTHSCLNLERCLLFCWSTVVTAFLFFSCPSCSFFHRYQHRCSFTLRLILQLRQSNYLFLCCIYQHFLLKFTVLSCS